MQAGRLLYFCSLPTRSRLLLAISAAFHMHTQPAALVVLLLLRLGSKQSVLNYKILPASHVAILGTSKTL